MNHQLHGYTPEELVKRGKAFEAAARAFAKERPKASTTEWTEFNLDWFARTAAKGLTVDARIARGSKGPATLDMLRWIHAQGAWEREELGTVTWINETSCRIVPKKPKGSHGDPQ
ncbi:MAG: hypothetical protein JXB05_29815 [Myxococcaceae bacterium]|nr:hypothetical protein [Myxococcaceae bacterium]